MEDFEYSVDISDRDWDCFFKECEECNLLPPSLAGVDDSGMSDIDDTGSILAKRAQKVDQTASLSEADCPIDGPPDCEGSPVEHFLSKHGVGGMESVLSGSEEDIHLQSVNIFFERLKNHTEAEKLPEPSQIKAGKNREAIQEEELCSDGKQASSSTLPKNIPKLNSVPVRGETAGGKETTEPVNTIRNINTMKKVQPASKILHKPAASNSVLKTNMSTSTETELFTREEACTETRANEEMLQNQSPDTPVCSETSPNVDEVIKVKMCTLFRDVKREDMSSSQCNTDPQHDQEIVSNVKWKEEQKPHFLQSNTTRTNKATSQESSPSASVKRKRRKKRQLSTDPAESGNGSDRQRESDEEQYAWRGGRALCLSEDIDLFYLNEPQKNVMSTSVSSVANNFPGMISGNVMRANVSHSIPPCDSQCPATETANSERREKVHAGSLRQPDKKSHNSIMGRENERDLKCCQAEVESITHSILPSADSYDRAVEVIQDDKQSAAKTVLAAEAGNSCRDNHTLCQSEAEPQQQLEIECNHQDRYSCTLGKTHLPLSETGGISSDVSKLPAHNIKSQTEILTRASCARLTSDCINSMSDKSCLCKSPSSLAVNTSVQETEHPLETFSKLDVLPERANLAEVMVVYSGKSFSSGEINLPGNEKERRETTLDTESVVSLSHENSTGMFVSSCSSVSQNNSEGRGEKTSPIMATNGGDEEDATPGPKGQSMSHQTAGSKCDLVFRAEDAFTASKYERKTKTHPVFAMSSFWNEMEKLTINDILGLRMNSKSAAASSLRPLQESEESDMFTGTDSGFCTQQESEQTARHVDMFINPNSLESNSGSVTALDSTSLRDVMWESEPVPVSLAADIYPETMKLTSVSDVSQPCFSGSAQKYLRKISKNVSVHDLHALESEAFSNAWKGQTLQTLDEEESEKVEFFTEGHVPKQDKAANCLPSSSIENYRISLTDIFHYIFGQKQPIPSQSAADNISTCYTDGNSVPETYDHFFSEFDTESFFCPLITAEDQEAPIFSCSRSKNRNLQFPEAYEYFFASSSSDDSSVESDEDESCSPVRVVTRFTRKPSAAQISTDIYENFFTDSDIKQNFFWKNTFSFRNINFTGATVQKQTSPSPLSLVPMRQSGRSLQRTIRPFNALGNQDMTYPDLLLYRLEDRISRQLAQQPFRHEDLQTAVSNPRLDASLLPFRQSDMCLVCIAFASWVLKTANPQVGDAWKAVLLANVSALSAIQYLRKYVKVESAASEKKLHHLDS